MNADYNYGYINFAAINIPQPNERLDNSKGWIQWGDDNLYALYLISLLSKSSLHSSILKNKAMFIGGQGWEKTNLSPDALMFLKNVYNEDDLDEILFKIALDLELYGMYYLNVIWSKDGRRISEVNYIDPSKVRVAAPDPDEKYPQVEKYWVSDGWENIRKYPPVLYQGFSTTKKKQKSQILQVKEYRPGTEWYGQPEYISAVRPIELEFEIMNWNLNNIKSGFSPSMHINFPIGIPSDEEMTKIVNRMKASYEGSDNAGKIMVTFSPKDAENVPTFTPIQTNTSDGRFLLLNEQVMEGIIKGHRVTNPALFGIRTKGELGGTSKDEMMESLEIFTTQYTEPKQRIIEKTFNWFAKINGIKDKFIITRYSPQFNKVTTKLKDIQALLESTLTPEQKYLILLGNDYDHITAMRLSGFTIGNDLKNNNSNNE